MTASRPMFYIKSNFDQDVAAARRARPVLSQHGLPHSCTSVSPLALALAKTDVWEGHAGQTQATSSRMQNP